MLQRRFTSALVILGVITTVGTGYRGTVSAAPEQSAPSATRTIVAFGDSLTSGHGLPLEQAFPAVLERTLRSQGLPFRVVNHGVSGDTTTDGVRRLKAALAERPEIMILALGANDGLRGVPVSTVRSNLETIIEAAQTANVKVLLCGMQALPLYGLEYTLEFHRLYGELSAKYDIPRVPFMLAGVIGNQDMLQPDFVHPNAAGAAEIAGNIWPYLQPLAAGGAVQQASLLGGSLVSGIRSPEPSAEAGQGPRHGQPKTPELGLRRASPSPPQARAIARLAVSGSTNTPSVVASEIAC